MILTKLTFDQLDQYNQIEMLKQFDAIRVYSSISDYTIQPTAPTVIDFAKEESMDLWRQIMNHDTCGIFALEEDNRWIGGCLVVTHSPDVHMLKGDVSNAVLWDIRVDSGYQHRGYGKRLLQQAIDFAKEQGTKRLLIETQNNNPDAIAFYESMGAYLLELNKHHYPEYPDEDQLIFAIDLT